MGVVRHFLPYSLSALLLVSLSAGIVVLSVKDIPLAERSSASARAGIPARPGAELSKTGRLAWWSARPEGGAQLWVANLDGTLRRAVAQTDNLRRVSKTRWTPDGSAVAYLESGTRVVLARVDGTQIEMRLTDQLLGDSQRLVDLRWSRSATKVAATVQRTADGRSDIWIAKVDGEWVRATQLDDAMAGEWLDDDELLVNTTGGLLGVLRDGALNQLQPISGLATGSAFIGEDGRVWFLAGRVSGGGTDADPMTLVSDPALWSAYVDGSDPRREVVAKSQEGLRLDGRWPDGRLLVHRAGQPAQLLLGGTELSGLSNSAGVIERARIAADKKSAIAFTSTRVVRLDLSRPGAAQATVLLDSVSDPDVWFPDTTRVARPAAPSVAKPPAARYAYVLAGSLWSVDPAGRTSLLRAGTPNRGNLRWAPVPLPVWSPASSSLLTTETTPGQQTVGVVTIDRSGQVTRLPTLGQVGRGAAGWSPDGRTIVAVTSVAGTQPAGANSADELQVRFASPTGAAAAAPVPGREAAWSKSGLYVLSNGTFDATLRVRTGQMIDAVGDAKRAALASVDALFGDTRAGLPATGVTSRGVAQLAASGDGSHLSLGLTWATNTQGRSFLAFVRVADARVTILPADLATDVTWSPAGAVIAYTASEARPQGPQTARVPVATLVDAVSGVVITKQDGRFAGWSPDGSGFYVARDTGLFWFANGAAEGLRIGPVGVPVVATTP